MMHDDGRRGRRGDGGEGRRGPRHAFGPGIPGDYFEQVDGTYVEPPCERARREREEREEAARQEVAGADGRDGVERVPAADAGEPSVMDAVADRLIVSDALLRVRLACNALEGMCRVVSEEHGLCMTAALLPPYHGDDARLRAGESDGEPPFSEWMILVNGEPAAMGCYEKLCEVWMDGPDAMHEWLEGVISWDIAAESLMDTLSEIFHLQRREGDDGGDDGYRGIFATQEEWDRAYEPVPEADGPDGYEEMSEEEIDALFGSGDGNIDWSDGATGGEPAGSGSPDDASPDSDALSYEDEDPAPAGDVGDDDEGDDGPCGCGCRPHRHHDRRHCHHGHHHGRHHRHGERHYERHARRHHGRHGDWGRHAEPTDGYEVPDGLRHRHDLQPDFQCEMPGIGPDQDGMPCDAQGRPDAADASSREIERAEARHAVVQALGEKGYGFLSLNGDPARPATSLVMTKPFSDVPVLVGIALPGDGITMSEHLAELACDAGIRPEMDYMLCYVDGDSVVVVREP